MKPALEPMLVVCALGGAAAGFAGQERPRATASDRDRVRELVFRSEIPADRDLDRESPVYCLAFGTEANPEGDDPPPAFMKRFRDLADIQPRSWCVEHRTGHRLSVGPVRFDVLPRYTPVKVARLWTVTQWFRGGGYSRMVEVTQETWGWEVSSSPLYDGPGKAPPVPEADLTEDRRRLAALAAAYAAAWNRRDVDAMFALDTRRPASSPLPDESRRRYLEPIVDTLLDATPESIDFPDNIQPWARIRLKLRGTWTQGSGTLIPLDPWKHEGAVTTVELMCYKTTSWWERGEWSLEYATLPWEDTRMIE